MQRLRHRDQVDAVRIESALLRWRDSIFNAWVSLRVCDLLFARVRRDDALEYFSKRDCRLAVTRRAIPRQLPRGSDRSEIPE